MNPGGDPVPSELFRAHPLEDSLRDWLSHAHGAADVFSDEEILALSADWATELVERVVVEPLIYSRPRPTSSAIDRRERRV